MTHKVIHPESISKMLHIVGILTNHIATSQLDTIKSQVPGDYLILKNTKKNKNYVEIGSKCATFYVSCTYSQYFRFCLIKFLNSDIDLLDLIKLGNPFQIKDPRKYPRVSTINCRPWGWNEKYWTPPQVMWNLAVFQAWLHELRVQGTSTFVYFRQ